MLVHQPSCRRCFGADTDPAVRPKRLLGATIGTNIAASNDILESTSLFFGSVRILFLYRLFQLVSFPFIVLFFAIRLLIKPAYWPHFSERLGFLPRRYTRTAPGAIWLHAVSVGEISTAVPLLRKLRRDDPRVPIYVSTTTLAGRRAADETAEGHCRRRVLLPLGLCFFRAPRSAEDTAVAGDCSRNRNLAQSVRADEIFGREARALSTRVFLIVPGRSTEELDGCSPR